MPHIITRRLEFDAAHRIVGHETKCKNLHGHRYVAEVSFTAGLDALGRVIDFNVVKEKLGGWIDLHWDHNIILSPHDPIFELIRRIKSQPISHGLSHLDVNAYIFGDKFPFVMPNDLNPTAENMGFVLYRQASEQLAQSHLTVTNVKIRETPNCSADYVP